MKKRSASMVAAGLIFTLVVGGLAVAIGMTGPSVSNGVPQADRSATEPVVRTVRRTLTVHKQAESGSPEVVQLAATAATATPPSPSGSDDDSTSGQEDHESEGSESEESEGSESEESEGPDDESSHDEGESHGEEGPQRG